MSEQAKRSLAPSIFFEDARGKSELQRAGCSVTRSRGNAKESATEKIPPYELAAAPISLGKGEMVR